MTVKVEEDSKYLNFWCSFHWIVLLLKDFFIPRVNHLKKEKERGGGKEEEEMKQREQTCHHGAPSQGAGMARGSGV